ncbi:hypothetical protein ACNAN0_05515 [Agrilactobacillus fermenti]|uniref:hypothetical protein n=1 Tax=Agrilactobacillus fermenti TaxID=2586909 RepID=UPI001E2BE071|nr:hypothetical protein [Agrilactobacillus fermenti]MCD2257002.1 hypothetical protein [Agrilactobacillus fermenti]
MVPLKLASWIGTLLVLIGLVSLLTGMIGQFSVSLEILASTTLIGGLILLTIGIMGNYLGRIFVQSRRRPLYVVSEIAGFKSQLNQHLQFEEHQRFG